MQGNEPDKSPPGKSPPDFNNPKTQEEVKKILIDFGLNPDAELQLPKHIHKVEFPVFRLQVFEYSDKLSVIDLNGLFFIADCDPASARWGACQLMFKSFTALEESIQEFTRDKMYDFVGGPTN